MSKYWLYNIIPNGFEYNLLSKVIEKYYGNWIHIDRVEQKYSFNIIISNKCSEFRLIKPNTVEVCVDKASMENIRRSIEIGRALLRQHVVWTDNTYSLFGEGFELEDYSIHPAYDIFIWRNGVETWILDSKNIVYGSNPLIQKRFGGEHLVYSGFRKVAKLIIPDSGFGFKAEQLSNEVNSNHLINFIETNKAITTYYTIISRKFLESLGEPDHVLISFSGGKDSLVTLDLAIKHYGREMVTAVYVDTGVDFKETIEYVNELSSKLGVNIEYVYVPVREYLSIYGYPTKTNRWCTLFKTNGFKKVLMKYKEKYRKILVLVGDRDSESLKRSRKPPVRKKQGYLEATPIKQWSTIHVQLYIWLNNLPENPLYRYGFYRLGCYICPALTSLERYIMITRLGFRENELNPR
ncbi:MAG: phosphoadenosine phosphosulfate reductase family protein [Desulfurococcaceae archaeon]